MLQSDKVTTTAFILFIFYMHSVCYCTLINKDLHLPLSADLL